MLGFKQLLIAVIALPLCALVIVMLSGTPISERHHLHHDTYSVSLVVSRTFVLVMVFMGVVGGLVGWLCHLGVFSADPLVPLAFFLSFQLMLLLMLAAVMRYQVMAYDDELLVRPPFGRTKTIPYGRIDRMEWIPSFLGPHLHDLRITTTRGVTARIWCLLDIEQILLRIDRFDTMSG